MDFKEQIRQAIGLALKECDSPFADIKLEHPTDPQLGDYSTNTAMAAYRELAIATDSHVPEGEPGINYAISKDVIHKNPREFAEQIVEKLKNNPELQATISKIEVAGPGFINFYLSEAVLSKELELALSKGERYGESKLASKKTMVLDHSHPNIAKRFGIGHLRSTIIGQAIINLYRFSGWEVIGDNFLGDWGTQFGSIIAALKEQNLKAEDLSIDDLERVYVDFNKRAKEDPELWEKAKAEFKKLEDKDPKNRAIWETIKKTSMVEFEHIWGLLNVKFDYIHGESFFEDKMAEVLQDAKDRDLAHESEGAIVIRIPGFENPLLLLKSDGATTYETRDLAAIKFWANEYSPDIIAYEVGSEQALHFQQVFTVAEMLGYFTRNSLIHIQHGLYLGSEGKKMRTRTGDTVRLEEVLDEAVTRAKKLGNVSDDVAKAVGIGAIKYFDLAHHHESNIIFDWEKVFQLEGNSAPYIQYTYARTQSILSKSKTQNPKPKSEKSDYLTFDIENLDLNVEELDLLRLFYRFPEIISEAASTYSPNLLCNFLFELASKYNTLYAKHKIVGAENEDFKLALTTVVGNILKSGLGILGIESPEKM